MTSTDRMSPLDSAFLHIEDAHAALHIASVALFDGPAPTLAELQTAVARKLPLVPRYRQRVRGVPFELGRPVWVDDPDFRIDAHVRRRTLPEPGGRAELHVVVDRIMSQRLDRRHPLWGAWLVDGLSDGRWVLVTKVHHSLADGIAGTDLLSTVLDSRPDGDPVPDDTWVAGPQPSALRLTSDAILDRASVRLHEMRSLGRAAAHPRELPALGWRLVHGMAGFATALRPVTASSLRGSIGSDRRHLWTDVALADVLAIRERLGGTVNDVVLAAVSHGFRDLLLARGETPGRHTVRTLVPVSVRRADGQGHTDNRVSAILADLPVEVVDPVTRLREVTDRMRHLKRSGEADTGEAVTELADVLPPSVLAAGLHLAFRVPQRMLTTVVTNVPGPGGTLYCCGRRMLATYPYVPIADRLRIGVAVTSYDGRLFFGVTGDAATATDLEALVDGIELG
ncbi:MAG: wax ester/triacylglycerol synthase family O-acyltransferase, partial [Nocardioides sp.]